MCISPISNYDYQKLGSPEDCDDEGDYDKDWEDDDEEEDDYDRRRRLGRRDDEDYIHEDEDVEQTATRIADAFGFDGPSLRRIPR